MKQNKLYTKNPIFRPGMKLCGKKMDIFYYKLKLFNTGHLTNWFERVTFMSGRRFGLHWIISKAMTLNKT